MNQLSLLSHFSGKDQLLPSQEEGKRLFFELSECEIRKFSNSGHFIFLVGSLSPPHHPSPLSVCILFCFVSDTYGSSTHVWQEDGIDLVTIIKAAGFYRRGKHIDYVSDYMQPTPTEFEKVYDENK
jgi:hypothetical protein